MNSAAYPPVTMRVCITALHVADEAVHQGRGAEIGLEYRRHGQLNPVRFIRTFQQTGLIGRKRVLPACRLRKSNNPNVHTPTGPELGNFWSSSKDKPFWQS